MYKYLKILEKVERWKKVRFEKFEDELRLEDLRKTVKLGQKKLEALIALENFQEKLGNFIASWLLALRDEWEPSKRPQVPKPLYSVSSGHDIFDFLEVTEDWVIFDYWFLYGDESRFKGTYKLDLRKIGGGRR